jgi:hypothetical protein
LRWSTENVLAARSTQRQCSSDPNEAVSLFEEDDEDKKPYI